MRQFKMLLLSTMVVFFTACGGGGGDTPTVTPDSPQTIAIDKIKAYADDNTQPVPTVENYVDAGVVGVTPENLDEVNSVVANLTSSDVDTSEEIQKIVDDLGINILPTANAGPDLSVQVNETITITGIGTDIDGTILSYEWRKDAMIIATTASFTYTPNTVETDTLTLTVTDDDGATASDSMNVTVTATPVPDTTPPIITVLGDNPATVIQNTTYTDAGATAIDDRDGPVAVVTTGSVDITKVGTYTITYTATDSANNTATATRTVNVIIGTPDAGISTVTASLASVLADGTTTSTITVTVKDVASNPVTDAIVVLTQTGASTISASTNVGNGTYTFTVKSTKVETVTYTATANSVVITQTANVDFIIGLPTNITIDNAALQSIIASIFDDTPYNPAIDMQGVIDSNGLKITVPYTVVNTPITLPAYSTSATLDASVTQDDEAGIIVTFAWTQQTNLPVGSGTFIATITIDDSAGYDDGIYKAKKLDIEDDSTGLVAAVFPYGTDNAGGTGILTLKIVAGIPDRMFGVPDNNGDDTTHNFLYKAVTNSVTGKTWLSNNLGANYANINSQTFNLSQQAKASNDHNAYGSLFQWGRKPDGHELINWTNGTLGTAVNGITTATNDNPTDTLFITVDGFTYDWRDNPDDTLWALESSTNNVCPVGFRVPTSEELDLESQSLAIINIGDAIGIPLKLTMPGFRQYYDGAVENESIQGMYWSSTTSSPYASTLIIQESSARITIGGRTAGYTVRCIKD